MSQTTRTVLVTTLLAGLAPAADTQEIAAGDAQEIGWEANGRDVQGTRYLPAREITRENVGRLELAWTYRTGEADLATATDEPPSFEATPLVVEGTMYIGTPLGRVIALDPATGRERWVYDPKIARNVDYGDFASRGVSTWLDTAAREDVPCRRRIFVATAQSQLIALDARDGKPCAGFGRDGMVDLKAGLRIPPFEPEAYTMTSPPVVVNGLVVTGSSVADNTRPDLPSGEVRAFDARTGALRWSWDPVPQEPGRSGVPRVARCDGPEDRCGERVVGAVGGPRARPGVRAHGQRCARLLRRAAPGRQPLREFHRGASRRDRPSGLGVPDRAPRPLGLRQRLAARARHAHRGDKAVPAVLQATKTGMLFVLDRETGAPVFPVEERAVPASDIPLEEAARTQPFTSTTPPLSPHRFALDEVWGGARRTAMPAAMPSRDCATTASSRRRASRGRWCCRRTSAERTGAASRSIRSGRSRSCPSTALPPSCS